MESSATEPIAAAKRNGHTVDMKQLQRYYSVLRDFMSFLHGKDDTYPANHEVRRSIIDNKIFAIAYILHLVYSYDIIT